MAEETFRVMSDLPIEWKDEFEKSKKKHCTKNAGIVRLAVKNFLFANGHYDHTLNNYKNGQ